MSATTRAARRGRAPSNGFDWVAFSLYTLMLLASSIALAAADWADHLAIIPPLTLLAAISGVALARSRFSDGLARIISLVYGLFFIGWFVGLTLDPALPWSDRVTALLNRFGAFMAAFAASQPNPDTLMFVLFMAGLFWLLGAYGAVSMFRRGHVWRGVLPPGLVLLVNAYYDIGHAHLQAYVAIYVLLTFLIIVRLELADRRSGWYARRMRVPAALGWDLGRVSVVAAILMVTAAWVGPAFAQSSTVSDLWTDVSGPWRSARDRLGNVVANLRSPVLFVGDSYGANLQLSAGTELGDEVVMEVEPAARLRSGGRFYWQARTYAEYDAGLWTAAPQLLRDFDPRQGDLPVPEWNGRQSVEIKFRPHFSVLSRLYIPSNTAWVDRTSQISFAQLPDGREDVTTFVARQPLYDGDSYTARGSIAVPTAAQLRGAGTAYPDWIASDYLQVPDTLTERFRALATSLGEGQPTPYDQAVAVTTWLRENIEYSRVTDEPPISQEPLDWFVFDYKVGYCNFYASSEVMMLRVLGIPARLAVGYAGGTLESSTGVYEVRGTDSHAWPEVFFSGYGWIPFEPTASQPIIRRPEAGSAIGADQNPNGADIAGANAADAFDRFGRFEEGQPLGGGAVDQPSGGVLAWLPVPLAATVLVLLLGFLAVSIDPAWRQSAELALLRAMSRLRIRVPHSPSRPLSGEVVGSTRAYLAWGSWLRRLGVPTDAADTPFERVEQLAERLPEAAPDSRQIVDAFVAERFGGVTREPAAVDSAWARLHRLFWRTYLSRFGERLLSYIQDPQRKQRAHREGAGPVAY
jgi:transglutaminase-like putative cysteine protease